MVNPTKDSYHVPRRIVVRLEPAPVPASTAVEQRVDLPGTWAFQGDRIVTVTGPKPRPSIGLKGARLSSRDRAWITFINVGPVAAVPSFGDYAFFVERKRRG